MKINGLEAFLEKIRSGSMPLGAAITFTDPAVTELSCASGFDFLWFDGEHGEFGRETAMMHLMAVKGTGVASLYRVPSCDHTEIKRIIDFAPAGVIIPMDLDSHIKIGLGILEILKQQKVYGSCQQDTSGVHRIVRQELGAYSDIGKQAVNLPLVKLNLMVLKLKFGHEASG